MICFYFTFVDSFKGSSKVSVLSTAVDFGPESRNGPRSARHLLPYERNQTPGQNKSPQQQPKDIIEVPDLNRKFRFERNVPKT